MTKRAPEQTSGTSLQVGEGVTRGKSGRRSVAERTQAVVDLLSGEARACHHLRTERGQEETINPEGEKAIVADGYE